MSIKHLLLVLILTSCQTRDPRCEQNGGHWESYNCREIRGSFCTYHDVGNGVQMPICTSTSRLECDHKCVGAQAEVVPKDAGR
jgi:hypothetical protein